MALHRLPSTARTLVAPFCCLRAPVPILALALLMLLSGLGVSLAQQATPASAPDVGRTEEVLCSGVLQAAYQPAGDAILDVGRTVFEPGTGVTWTADDLTPSTGFDCVISGSYSLVLDGKVEVVRSTGERESYQPGEEVTATAGDIVYLLENGREQTYRAIGDEPLVTVFVGLFQAENPPCFSAGTCTPFPETMTIEWLGGMQPTHWAQTRLQERDVTVTVRSVTLEPDGMFAVTPDDPPTTWFVVDGPVRWISNGARVLTFVMLDGTPIIYIPLSGTNSIEIRNDESDPAVLIEIELTPAGPASATPVT